MYDDDGDRDNQDEANRTDERPYGVTDAFDAYPDWLLQFAAICFVVFVAVGVPGNAITALALSRRSRSKTVRNATAAFIVNLSLADLLFCLINIPLAVSNFAHRGWVHGESLCVLSAFLRYGNVGVSLLTVTVITINRYVTIVHAERFGARLRLGHQSEPTAVRLIVAAVWLASFGPLVPTLSGVWGRFGFDAKVGTCSIVESNGQSPKAFLFLLAFVLPCVIICLCYVRIFCVVRRSRIRRCRNIKSAPGPEAAAVAAATTTSRDQHAAGGADLRLVKMILVIFGSFVLCNLPLTLVKVFGKERDMKVLNVLGYVLLYASSCVNPIVYVAMSRDYRLAYIELLANVRAAICGQTSAGQSVR